ncbi:MAG: hypothetical protein NVS2B16_00110 [Chloroflexota bacterium]
MTRYVVIALGALLWLLLLLATNFNVCAVSVGLLAVLSLPDRPVTRHQQRG